MQYIYNTKGTCSRQIVIDVDDNNVIENATFIGGCNGNLQGINALIKGLKIDEVITRLSGIKCGFKQTSCPDQLATALKQIKEKKEK